MQLRLLKRKPLQWIVLIALFLPGISSAQNGSTDSTLQSATLDNVVKYALEHQPAVRQAKIDQEITEKVINGKLADWYPQVNFNASYQRTIDRQQTVFGPTINDGKPFPVGVFNLSTLSLSATQNIFNRDVLLASTTASKVRLQSEYNTGKSKIDVVVNVTKAFYDLIATAQQIKVNEESIVRLRRSLKDAKSRYNAGIADKTDYKRAMIQLNNSEASLKGAQEQVKYKQEYLKTLMGYPAKSELTVVYDTIQMENEISVDTLQTLNYAQHIDYRIINMQKELQHANVKYSQWAFLPVVSANYTYNSNYLNNKFSDLYNTAYPFSYVGATLALPIFQGGKRIAKIREQKWTEKRIDVGIENLQNTLTTEYTRAIASYKANLSNYYAQKENVDLAQEVYDVINLQYRNGVRTYLDVTVAETDLRTTRINYFNALNLVLASKMDVLRALGQINY